MNQMPRWLPFFGGVVFAILISAMTAAADEQTMANCEQQFRNLPLEARRLTGPLFWLHGDDSPEQLKMYVEKVFEGGNGCFTAESRPHVDWLGAGWYRDLAICLEAAKKHGLKMWIFDEKWWPSQGVGGNVPPRYAAKRLAAAGVEVNGPQEVAADGYGGDRYVAAVAGRLTADGKIEVDSLVDLAPFIKDGKLSWQAPAGKWRVMKFTHVQAPALGQNGQLSVDGASRDCVDWFLKTVYQPHYDHFGPDFGKTIPGFFYDESETRGDWGTELNAVLAERKVDWKQAYVAYKFELAGPAQTAARYQYFDAFAEAWGRTMYGGITAWCHQHGVKSIGHFMEHGGLYRNRDFCAGDMMRLQSYSDMGGIDAVFKQFVMGQRESTRDAPIWQTPKLGSSISHVYGKPDDVTMVEIFGARGQDLTYAEMKWWTDHMQVSGVNFMIPHSFNPRSPYDTDCPPYFYNNGFEPRWPLYRVYADYTNRLSLLLHGGRHVCPVALLFVGQSAQVGRVIFPEEMTTALQDAQIDCDWLPYDVWQNNCRVADKEIHLYSERYKVLIVPGVEVIPYAALAKAKEFLDAGGVVVGYGIMPSQSAALAHPPAEIAALCRAIWGADAENAQPGLKCRKTSAAGGRSYFLGEKPTPAELQQVLADDAGIRPTLQVLAGETSGWLHVLHRVKNGRDVFLICNQNHEGAARQFKLRATAQGVPEIWDAMRNEITALPYQRDGADAVTFSLTLEPLETVLLVFQPQAQSRPMRIGPDVAPIHAPLDLVRDPNPAPVAAVPEIPPRLQGKLARCQWVWYPEGNPQQAAPPGTCYFRRTVNVPANRKIKRATCVFATDNQGLLFVNGQRAGQRTGWESPLEVDIQKSLKPGVNVLAIQATNTADEPNPAGLIGRYAIEFDRGAPLIGTIDKSWKTACKFQKGWNSPTFEDSKWVAAREIASLGDAPWGQIERKHVTLSPLAAADPFRTHFTLPSDVDLAATRVYVEMDGLPGEAAAIAVNGVRAGGVIGRPLRLDISGQLKKGGENTLVIEPLAPKAARLVFYPGATAP